MTTRFNVSDPDGSIRRGCKKISRASGIKGITGAIRYAVKYTVAAQRRDGAPLDYESLELEKLIRHLDLREADVIREAAARELARRIGNNTK